jgi:glucokinase
MIGAVDIGGTKIALGLVDRNGHLLAHKQFPTGGWQASLDGICSSLKELAAAQEGNVLEGIGVGCTGPVYPMLGTVGMVEFIPDWEGKQIAGELSQRLGVAVALENDADAAALGEAAWGAGKGAGRFILVTIGTGIGGGLVFDGKLYRGVDDSHPEIGHHVVDISGPPCYCGGRGCWEMLASGPSMAAWFRSNAPADYAGLEKMDAKTICARAGQGDKLAEQAVEREGEMLGIGLANLINLFSPDVIALGGSVMQSWSLFSERVNRKIQQNCTLVPYQKTSLRLAALGADSGLIGAAQAYIHRFAKTENQSIL